jgi:hypothetical protein
LLREILARFASLLERKPGRQTLRHAGAAHFPDSEDAFRLLERAFRARRDRTVPAMLIDAARGANREPWRLRCLAVLLLEHLMWRHREDAEELGRIAALLGVANTEQLRRRMARLDYLHRAVAQSATPANFAAFLSLVDQECLLTLARYAFSAEEVWARINQQMQESEGVRSMADRGRAYFDGEAESAVARLPSLEAALVRRLSAGERVYWVADHTSSRLNALVEYPLTSAVLVIKPPGSDVELEIKRAGLRGERRLNVIYQRPNGDGIAPVSHRLHGSSFGWLGRREADAASFFAAIYRLVHGEEAPLCLTLGIVSPRTVPGPCGEAHILDYLTSPSAFGKDFDRMRAAIREAVDRLPADTGIQVHRYRGEMGLTLQFLSQALPQQALLLNTTSFRLDRIALYLSAEGPAEYFTRGLKTDYVAEDACQLADTVLCEILGTYARPRAKRENYAEYVKAAFALPANRALADDNFRECMRQAGHFWGTLLGVRGYTDGESFVVRNAGIRCVWERDQWRVRMVFMDHDDLFVLGRKKLHFWPYRAVHGMYRDCVHILGGGGGKDPVKGEVGFLREIYAVSDATYETGMTALRDALRSAYRKTLLAVESDHRLRGMFHDPFAAELRDWDTVARIRLDAAGAADWRAEAMRFLESRSYASDLVRNYVDTAVDFGEFLSSTSFLYERR